MISHEEATEVPRPTWPYPGLRPFEEEEWPLFFGREAASAEVAERLLKQRLVLVHGSSGCGKSSLVRAGVLPRLAQIHEGLGDGRAWRRCTMRPGDAPLRNLAEALSAIGGAPDAERTHEIRRRLDQGRRGLPALAEVLGCSAASTVCIVIDQFEEIFRYAREGGWDEVGVLADLLIGIERDRPPGLMVLVTMRSDFLGDCARVEGLAETFNRTQYLLPRMSRGDLLRAIEEPALMYDGRVTRELAERLIADAHVAEDELPLIQHVLLRLWRDAPEVVRGDRRERVLDVDQYARGGDLSRHLTAHAETVAFPPGSPPKRNRLVRALFRALTDVNVEKQAIRRPRRFADLRREIGADDTLLRRVIDEFRAEGVSFLTPYAGTSIDAGTMIDISHEAFARRWTRLSDPATGWLELEFRDGQQWRSYVVQAEAFARDPKALLSAAASGDADTWCRDKNEAWAERYGGDWAGVQALVHTSVARSNRARFWRRCVAAIIMVLATTAGWLAVTANEARQRADVTRDRALADAERQSDLNDIRAVQVAVGTLFPTDAESDAKAIRIQASAREAVGRLPQRRAELEELRASASSQPSVTSWEFTDPTDTARHRVLTDFTHDATDVAKAESGALAVLASRFTRGTAEDVTALWRDAITQISDEKANPRYHGLRITPLSSLVPLGQDSGSHLFEFAHLYSGSLPRRGPDGKLVERPDSAIVLVLIPGGTFWRGAATKGEHNVDSQASEDEAPVREVKLDPFYLSKYECTQAQWDRLTGGGKPADANGQDAGDARRNPKTSVSWEDCASDASWLPKFEFRLPTEAQWEFACRAGTSSKYWSGNDEADLARVGWYSTNSEFRTHVVGEKPANPWGLFDMHGNVWEWCEDSYSSTYEGAPTDGRARIEAGPGVRVLRGGSFAAPAEDARSAHRRVRDAGFRLGNLGLRPARPVTPR